MYGCQSQMFTKNNLMYILLSVLIGQLCTVIRAVSEFIAYMFYSFFFFFLLHISCYTKIINDETTLRSFKKDSFQNLNYV